MKFGKHILFTVVVFCCIASLIVYSACEKDTCSGLQCQNGGYCTAGYCQCPAGYEGSVCEMKLADRFLGVYYGSTFCDDHRTPLNDTTTIYMGADINSLVIVNHPNNIPDTNYGHPVITQAGYEIIIPEYQEGNYSKTVTLALDVKKIIMHKTIINNGLPSSSCYFNGAKK